MIDHRCFRVFGPYFIGKSPCTTCRLKFELWSIIVRPYLSKEQNLFKSVTRLNPVFQPILNVTIVTVDMGWNTGFSPVTD